MIKYISLFGGMSVRLFVKIFIVFFTGIGVIELFFGMTTTRDDFNSGCMGNVRQIVGGGARIIAGRG